jgi:hypothetical protein
MRVEARFTALEMQLKAVESRAAKGTFRFSREKEDAGEVVDLPNPLRRQLMERTGDIYLASEKGRCVAYWLPADGSPERFLCAADADACGKHPHLRDLLIELAAEVRSIGGARRTAGAAADQQPRSPGLILKRSSGARRPSISWLPLSFHDVLAHAQRRR